MKSIIAYLSLSAIMLYVITNTSTRMVNDLSAALNKQNDRFQVASYEQQ